MAVLGPRTDEEWSDTDYVTLTGGARPSSDDLILAPDDLSPNRNWREIDEDGNPRAWGIDLPPASVGDFPYVSDPGNSDDNPDPPRRDTLSRQTGLSIPPGSSHTQFQKPLSGWEPGQPTSRLPRQGPPLVEIVNASRKGFQADLYGVSYDLRKDKRKDRTTPSGLAPLQVSTGQGIGVFVPPEAFGTGARYMGVYVTRQGSGGLAGTEREQGVADLKSYPPGSMFELTGPYDDNGRRPSTRDLSGYGRMPEPLWNRRRHGRVCVIEKHARFDLAEGYYNFGYQAYPKDGGSTPVSRLTERKRIDGDVETVRRELKGGDNPEGDEEEENGPDGKRYAKKQKQLTVKRNTALWFFWPGMPEGWEMVPWILWQPLTQGPPVWFRAYAGRSIYGAEMSFGEDKVRKGIPFYGYGSDTEPGGLRWRAMGGATPVTEDTTGLPVPDETTGPDVVATGPGLPEAPATYFFGTTREDEFGGESAISQTARERLTDAGTTFRISPDPTTNELRNPQGAERTSDDAAYDWTGLTGRNATPAAYFEDGALILTRAGNGVSPAPLPTPVEIPGEDASVTIRGRLRVGRFTGGTDPTQLVARFLNSDGGTQQDVELLRVTGFGEIDLGEDGYTFGPDADAEAAVPTGSTAVQLVARGIGTDGVSTPSQWNSTAYFEDLGIFLRPAALKRFEDLGPEEPANFDPPSGIGFPHSSASACGPAPNTQDAGASPEPLIDEVTFESGAWTSGWTNHSGNNTTADFTEGVKTPPSWAASTAKSAGAQIVEAGRVFVAQDAGTTANGTTVPKPAFASVGRGGTVVDNPGASSITWKETGDALYGGPPGSWHEIQDTTNNTIRQFLKFKTLAADQIESAGTWAASTAYAVGDRMRPVTTNGHWYQATVAGTSGGSAPAYATNGSTFTDGGVTWRDMGTAQGRSLFVRILDANPTLPSRGEVLKARILDGSGSPKVMGSVYYAPTQVRLYRHKANGDRENFAAAIAGLSAGTPLDIELGITGGGTTRGAVTLSGGRNYNQRVVVASHQNRDFTGRFPRRVEVGYRETDAGIRMTSRIDNVLLSRTGAPLDYEHPAEATGTTVPATAPPPDAPPSASASSWYRLFDVDEKPINQWWWYAEPNVPRASNQDYGAYCKAPITVVPGETITQGLQGRFRLFEDPLVPADGREAGPSHQFFVTLHGPGVPSLEVGSPFGPGRDSALVTRTGGSRSNSADGMALYAAHDDEDFWQAFVVPAGYHWATIGPKNGVGGVYLFQEHLFHPDEAPVTTQAGRDAFRTYGRATAGSASVVIDASGETNPYKWPLYDGRLTMGVKTSNLADGASVTNIRFRGGASPTGPWSAYQTDPFLVPESKFYEVSFDMTGQTGADGVFPTVASGSVFVIMRPWMTMCLRPDGSEIPGGTFVNGHDSADDRADTEAMVLDGDIVAPTRSKRVQRFTRDVTVHIATEEAKRYIESLTEGDTLEFANPFLSGTGRRQEVRIGTRPVVDTSLATARVESNGAGEVRNVYGTFTIPAGAQVLEEGPLSGP